MENMESEKKSSGALIGSIIIIVILLIGGIYTWQLKVKENLAKKQIPIENQIPTNNTDTGSTENQIQ